MHEVAYRHGLHGLSLKVFQPDELNASLAEREERAHTLHDQQHNAKQPAEEEEHDDDDDDDDDYDVDDDDEDDEQKDDEQKDDGSAAQADAPPAVGAASSNAAPAEATAAATTPKKQKKQVPKKKQGMFSDAPDALWVPLTRREIGQPIVDMGSVLLSLELVPKVKWDPDDKILMSGDDV